MFQQYESEGHGEPSQIGPLPVRERGQQSLRVDRNTARTSRDTRGHTRPEGRQPEWKVLGVDPRRKRSANDARVVLTVAEPGHQGGEHQDCLLHHVTFMW